MSASLLSTVRIFSGVLVFAFASVATGEEAALRLSDVLARAAEHNPHLAAHAYAESAAEALIEQAALRPSPTLDFEAENFAGTGERQGVRRLEATVQASQAIERGGKREKRVTVATRDRDVAAKERAVKRAEVLGTAAVAFVETLAAQRRAELAEQPVGLAREIFDAAEARVRAGEGSPAESARARAALASAQGEKARAEAELGAARARLAATWSGAASEVPTLQGALQMPDALPSERAFFDRLAEHPRIAHQHAIVAVRRASLELARAQAAQDITVGGGVRFLHEGSDAALVAGVSVPLPMRNRNQGNIRAARENIAGAEMMVRAIEAELRGEFAAAWQQVAAAHAAAQALRKDALPALEQANSLARRAYQQGELPLRDVLDAQRELNSLRRELLELERAFAVAHARAEALADSSFSATAALFAK